METTKWDVVDFLDSPEAIAAYLNAAMEDGDPALINAALGDIARAQGMSKVAKETGLAREALYRSLRAEGHPEFSTVVKVVKSLGLQLVTNPIQTKEPRSKVAAAGKRQTWSKEDVAALRKMAKARPIGIVAYKLGRSEAAVRGKAAAEGVSFGRPARSPYGRPTSSSKGSKRKRSP
jgi:probable addiction module antidote protein